MLSSTDLVLCWTNRKATLQMKALNSMRMMNINLLLAHSLTMLDKLQ